MSNIGRAVLIVSAVTALLSFFAVLGIQLHRIYGWQGPAVLYAAAGLYVVAVIQVKARL